MITVLVLVVIVIKMLPSNLHKRLFGCLKDRRMFRTYKSKEHHESSNVPDHPAQGDLQGTKNLKCWHEVGRAGKTDHIGYGK